MTTGEAPQGRRGAELAANARLPADGASHRQAGRPKPQPEVQPTAKAGEIVAPKRAARKPVEVRVEEAPRLHGDAPAPETRRKPPERDRRPARRDERRAPGKPNIPEPPAPAPARDDGTALLLLAIALVATLLMLVLFLR